MPYLPDQRKQELKANPNLANTEGDANYLFTLAYLDEWAKEPRYHTIAKLENAIANYQSVRDVHLGLLTSVKDSVIVWTAMRTAFLEFYRRIGSLYEDYAIEKNGDLEEYLHAEQIIHKLASNVVQKTI